MLIISRKSCVYRCSSCDFLFEIGASTISKTKSTNDFAKIAINRGKKDFFDSLLMEGGGGRWGFWGGYVELTKVIYLLGFIFVLLLFR